MRMQRVTERAFVLFGLVMSMTLVQSVHAKEYKVDSSHSSVSFMVRHLVSKVVGNFKEFDGSLSFDPKKPEDTKVNASVQTSSINTENKKRDDHLQSDDFFSAKKFPKLTFVSSKITPTEKNKYQMVGDLTIRGVKKPVTFDVEYLGEAKDPWGGTRAGFTATTKINRKDFGMVWNKALDNGGVVLSDEVEINVNFEALEVEHGKEKH